MIVAGSLERPPVVHTACTCDRPLLVECTDSRREQRGSVLRVRRHRCGHCQGRLSTVELVKTDALMEWLRDQEQHGFFEGDGI